MTAVAQTRPCHFLTNGRFTSELDRADFAMNPAWLAADEQADIVRERQLPQVPNWSFGPKRLYAFAPKRPLGSAA